MGAAGTITDGLEGGKAGAAFAGSKAGATLGAGAAAFGVAGAKAGATVVGAKTGDGAAVPLVLATEAGVTALLGGKGGCGSVIAGRDANRKESGLLDCF